MNTPIRDFVDKYLDTEAIRLHMPGHKGVGDIQRYDITEIEGADVLYNSATIIRDSERNLEKLYGTSRSVYSTEGSTLGIKAMLTLAHMSGVKKIIAPRNVHKAFVYAVAHLSLDVEWLAPSSDNICLSHWTVDDLNDSLDRDSEGVAVYVTSPDYLGNILDVRAIAKVCKAHRVPLLVDNAHGAYLRFLPKDIHPISLGASMCVDSAHKTLNVLTAGAYLHLAKDASDIWIDNVERAMAMYASTSPSYLVLRSLDIQNAYMDTDYRKDLREIVDQVGALKENLISHGYTLVGDEPLKVCVDSAKYGYTGTHLAKLLRESNIEVEYSDQRYLVMMFSEKNTVDQVHLVAQKFANIPRLEAIYIEELMLPIPKRATSIREALLSPTESIDVKKSENRIYSDALISCPPAIPVLMSGEIVSREAIEVMQKLGISQIKVVK